MEKAGVWSMSKSKTLNCPECGCTMRLVKSGRYECDNPKCCVIEVRVHKWRRHILREART